MSILEIKNLNKIYGKSETEVKALSQINLKINSGEFVVIVGKSGSGKSTLLHIMAGLETPTNGDVIIDNINISSLDEKKRSALRKEKLGLIFQSYNLIHYMNAYENVANAIEIAGRKVQNKKEYCLDILKKLGLSKEQSLRDIRKLSGGQQQRIAIARAIAKDVDLILADEPTGNLDEKNSKEILKTFIDLAHQANKCIIIVTHSPSLAQKCDVQLKIEDGQIVEI